MNSENNASQSETSDANQMQTLAEFVEEAHCQITRGTLKIKTYRKVVKRLLFELAATMDWLHADLDCADLNISANSILIENGDIENGRINPDISMVLMSDFSEQKPTDIQLLKEPIDITDMNSFGLIFYYCLIGEYTNDTTTAIVNGRLKQYLGMYNLLRFVSPKLLDLLNQLLNGERLSFHTVIQHQCFKNLYKKYGKKKRKENVFIVQKEMQKITFADIFIQN